MRSRLVLSIAAAASLIVAVTGCSVSPTSPSAIAPFSQTDIRLGTGNAAATGNLLTVNYSGWLYDPSQPDQKGALFDSSYATGRTTFTFTLGAGQTIAGWDKGLVGMKEGGLRRLIIPPSLGYGATRNGPIPPNATLIFDVELIAVQ